MTGSIGLSLKGLSRPGSEFSHLIRELFLLPVCQLPVCLQISEGRGGRLIQQINPLYTKLDLSNPLTTPSRNKLDSPALDLLQLLFSVEKRGSDRVGVKGGEWCSGPKDQVWGPGVDRI